MQVLVVPLRFVLVLLAVVLTSCGVSMVVVGFNTSIRTPTGTVVPVFVEGRSDFGALDAPSGHVGDVLLGLVSEPVDVVVSTLIGVNALFRSDLRVEGGPVGWLASLTPFATLTRPLYPSWFELSSDRDRPRDVTAEQLARLRAADPMTRAAAAREVFHWGQIIGAELR